MSQCFSMALNRFFLSESGSGISCKSFLCSITGNRKEVCDGFYRYLQWASTLPLEVFGTDFNCTNLPFEWLKEESTLAGNCMSNNGLTG